MRAGPVREELGSVFDDLIEPADDLGHRFGCSLPIRLPIRPMESVRIWLIFTQDRLGKAVAPSSRVSGKPARWGWFVIGTAITVPERSLKMSWLRMRTGRRPACSCPRAGWRSAQRISPLNI